MHLVYFSMVNTYMVVVYMPSYTCKGDECMQIKWIDYIVGLAKVYQTAFVKRCPLLSTVITIHTRMSLEFLANFLVRFSYLLNLYIITIFSNRNATFLQYNQNVICQWYQIVFLPFCTEHRMKIQTTTWSIDV